MKLEDQVTSYELSKKLFILNIKQNSQFYWVNKEYTINNCDVLLHVDDTFVDPTRAEPCYSAFTASELSEMLPCSIEESSKSVIIQKIKTGIYHDNPRNILYLIQYRYGIHETEDENLSNALAKMLIYLTENNLWKTNE